jgi:hypothetical protein
MNKVDIYKGLGIGLAIIAAAYTRVIPHPWNFTPMVAIFLFSAAYIQKPLLKVAFPFLVIVLSDVLIEIKNGYGFHSGTAVVYTSYLIMAVISYFGLKKLSAINVIKNSLLASCVFFLITNFAFLYPEAKEVNLALGHYPHNLEGIKASYIAALPFFRNGIFGDLMFSGILFGSYELYKIFVSKVLKLA